MRFNVKSIVKLDQLHISGFDAEATAEPERHTVVQQFIERFRENPVVACRYLVERSNPRVDVVTLASLLFKTPELDRTQLGVLLAGNDKLLKAFIDRFHFADVRVDDALRVLLLALRLPQEGGEAILQGFAQKYFEANRSIPGYDQVIETDLVLAITQLNDALYGMYGFAPRTVDFTEEAFVNDWRSKDPRGIVADETLMDIYGSIRSNSLAPSEDTGYEVEMTPSKFPSRLTCGRWSDEIKIAMPKPDPDLEIKLLGDGLEFEPKVLHFHGKEAVFRVRGTSLGQKSILFCRTGRNA